MRDDLRGRPYGTRGSWSADRQRIEKNIAGAATGNRGFLAWEKKRKELFAYTTFWVMMDVVNGGSNSNED